MFKNRSNGLKSNFAMQLNLNCLLSWTTAGI